MLLEDSPDVTFDPTQPPQPPQPPLPPKPQPQPQPPVPKDVVEYSTETPKDLGANVPYACVVANKVPVNGDAASFENVNWLLCTGSPDREATSHALQYDHMHKSFPVCFSAKSENGAFHSICAASKSELYTMSNRMYMNSIE